MSRRLRTNEQVLAGLGCNISEAARVLGVCWETVKALIDEGALPTFQVGREKRISVVALKTHAQGSKTQVPPA